MEIFPLCATLSPALSRQRERGLRNEGWALAHRSSLRCAKRWAKAHPTWLRFRYRVLRRPAICHIPKLGTKIPKMGTKANGKSVRAAPRKRASASTPVRAGLADALFTGTQQRVLGLLFGQPERSFFATELFALAGSGRGAVQRELGRLEESGLIAVTRMGNQKHYQANAAAPIFAELCAIVTKTGGAAAALRSALAPLAPRMRFAALYGSIAKGSDRAQSDVDLLVIADDLTLEQLFSTLAPVEKRLGRAISPTLYTSAEFRRRRASKNPFLEKVLAGAHQVLIGDEGAAASTR